MLAELKLIPPKAGRTPNYQIRGTYLGRYVDRSSKTGDRATARKVLDKIKREIERGEFAEKAGPTFASAAISYMNTGGERRFMAPILAHLGSLPLASIDQKAIEDAAEAICPGSAAATRNRNVYTPVSAVLRHVKFALKIVRPEGAAGSMRTAWLRPEEADSFLAAAWRLHPRFAALCTTLLYTGLRLSEGLRLKPRDIRLEEAYAEVGVTKNGEPRGVHLPPIVVTAMRRALMEHGQGYHTTPRTEPRTTGTVFCLTKCAHLYQLFAKTEAASGVYAPDGVSFHLFRHTYGAWMRRYAKVQLHETGAWTSRAGAKPYDHYDVAEAAKQADRLPGAGEAPALSIRKAS